LESIKKVIQSVLRRFLMPDIHMLILVVRPNIQFCSS
jgi:hypothetical protein